MGYGTSKFKLPNKKGKSKWIASQSTKPAATINAPSKGDLHYYSIFPSVEWDTAIPALTHRHRQYMVEDCLQCDVNESLLLLISPFGTGWQNRLSAVCHTFPTSALHFHDNGIFYFVQVQVIKNPIQELLMAGSYSVTTFLALFSFCGGSSLALCFIRATIDGLELKFANIFYSSQYIHIWGIQNDTRNLKGQLKKMNNPGQRSTMFQRYLLQLYGDRASTKYLCSSFAHVLDNASNDIDLQQIRDRSISGNKIVKTFCEKVCKAYAPAVSCSLDDAKFQ
jgi:hypothetical protein